MSRPGTISRRCVTGDGRRPQPEPERPQRSGGPAYPSILERSVREEVPQERGKNLEERVLRRGRTAIGQPSKPGMVTGEINVQMETSTECDHFVHWTMAATQVRSGLIRLSQAENHSQRDQNSSQLARLPRRDAMADVACWQDQNEQNLRRRICKSRSCCAKFGPK